MAGKGKVVQLRRVVWQPYSTLSLCYSLLMFDAEQVRPSLEVSMLTIRTDLLSGILLYVLRLVVNFTYEYLHKIEGEAGPTMGRRRRRTFRLGSKGLIKSPYCTLRYFVLNLGYSISACLPKRRRKLLTKVRYPPFVI